MPELTIYDKYAKDGRAAVNARNYREAEACWYTAMKVAEYFGEHDPRLTEAMEQLAAVYEQLERHKESEQLKSSAGKIKTRVTGTNLPPHQGPMTHSGVHV
jgi:hypothetical protein